jgi:hypothetical protein
MSETASKPPAKRAGRRSLTRSWRPSWNDYAEVTTAFTEDEIIDFLLATIKDQITSEITLTRQTLRAIAHAGLIGDAPGWRKALAPSFKKMHRKGALDALAALQRALCAGAFPLDPRYGRLLRRAISTSAAMGVRLPDDA